MALAGLFCYCIRVVERQHAILAQSVERIHGKDEVPGSIPGDGSSAAGDSSKMRSIFRD